MWVSIEGNIKPTVKRVLEALREKDHQVCDHKQYDSQASDTDNTIEYWESSFQKEKSRWAFALQMKSLSFLMQTYKSTKPVATTFIEGSCSSLRHVYGQLYYNQSYISSKEWDLFKGVCDFVQWIPDVFVYMHGGSEDSQQTSDDHTRLEFLYHNMLKFYQGKVIYIDASGRTEDDIINDLTDKLKCIGVHL